MSKSSNAFSISLVISVYNKATDDELVECNCTDHTGKQMLNKVFNLSVNHVYDCMFTDSDFNLKYWKKVKFENIKAHEWTKSETPGELESRKLEYSIDLGAFGCPKNIEDQVSHTSVYRPGVSF